MVMKNKIVIRRGFQVLILVILALSFLPIQQVNAEVSEISDADSVAADLAPLASTDISGANTDLDNVKVALAPLPTTGANGTTISWESSDESIVSNDGQTVIRPVGSGDASITLTATVSKNAESDTSVFNITVISDKTALTKWIVGGNNFTVGEPITFWLKLRINEGTTKKIVIKDILPAGMAFNSASIVKDNDDINYKKNNEPEVGDTGELVWDLGTIVNPINANDTDDIITVIYTVIILDEVENVRGTWLYNRAYLEFTDGGGNVHITPNTTGSVRIIEPEIKVEAEITSTYPYDVGDTVTHRITISHTGESNATAYDVKITDILPEGLSYASYTVDTSYLGEPIKDGNNVVFGDAGNIDLNLGASYTFNVNTVLDTELEPQKLKNYNVQVDYSSTNGENAYERHYTSNLVSSVDIPDEETVSWVKKVLKIIYAEGDSADSVTQGLTLPTTGGYGTTITWTSSNESILSNDGQTVNRPAFGSGDASVTLTATVSKNAESDIKVFNITVLEKQPTDAEAVAADLATLAATDISGTNADLNNVKVSLTSLPTTGANGTTISWESSNESILSNDGQTVSRPAFGIGDASITLTATVSKNAESDTQVFNITVLETPLTDAESVAADLSTLAATDISGANIDLDNVIGALASLPTTGANGTTITWTSSNESIVSNDGQTVNRPAFGSGDASITLTATVSENAESDTKVFNITVLEIPPTDAESVATDLATLAATDISGTNADLDNVRGALASLPTTGANGTTITWTSSNESILSNDGQTVNRPAFGSGDTSITLTATVSKNVESDITTFNIIVNRKSKPNKKVTPQDLIKQGDEILEAIEESSGVWLEKKINDYIDKANKLLMNQTIDTSTANDLVSKINEVIIKVVNKAGKIEGINLKVESAKVEATLTLGSQKLIKAAENAMKTAHELSMKLEENGMKELTKEFKAEVKIEVPEEIKKKEEVKVELPLEALNQLAGKEIDILIEADGVTFKIPSELVGVSTDNFIVEISTKKVHDQKEQELKDSREDKQVKNAVLELKSKPLDLNINKKDEAGNTTTKIEKFNKQPVLEIPLDSIDLENVDINKLGIYVFDEENGNWEYIKTEIKDGKLVAVAPHFSIYAVLEFNKEYIDTTGHWAKEDIDIMAARHIANYVYGEDNLKPEKKITRAEFATLIVRALGIEKNKGSYQFDDVDQDSWYANDIALAADAGIINGIGSRQFAPNENITREQMAVMMARTYKIINGKDMMVEEITFPDKDDISSWAVEAVKAAFSNNIVTGFGDGTFKPQKKTTRAQGIVMLKRLLDI